MIVQLVLKLYNEQTVLYIECNIIFNQKTKAPIQYEAIVERILNMKLHLEYNPSLKSI